MRDAFIPAITSLPAIQRRAAGRLSQVSVAYRSSPLNQPDRERHGPRPGERIPDLEVFAQGRKTRLYEVLRRGWHVLLVSAVDVRTALESAGLTDYNEFIKVVTGGIGATPDKDKPGTIALVRPDGILAARGTRNDCEDVIGYLRLLFRGREAKQAIEHSSQVSSMGELIVT